MHSGFKIAMLFLLAALVSAATRPAHGQAETVLYSFAGSPDGASPYYGTPVLDKKGNLYGTTLVGGAGGYGTAFKVTPSGIETILHSFNASGDGAYPEAGVVLDKKGNLYGTTSFGGAYGYGTVFKVTPSGAETILHTFGGGGDGAYPEAGVVLDKKRNLYGTTSFGGGSGYGTVFKVTPSGAETILYGFGASGQEGIPYGGVILDKLGNLYGTTTYGGTYDLGTVFELTPSGTETILYSFGGTSRDGYYPQASLVLDKKGNLYGTTLAGGTYYEGTVFKLTPSGTETVLYSFGSVNEDGYYPQAALTLGKKGNLYGTTPEGGAYDAGTVFEVTPSGTETILHSFGASGDGVNPYGSLALDTQGNLYSTTAFGGAYGSGTVFEVTPSGTETVLYSFGANGDGANPYSGLILNKLGNLYGTTQLGGANNQGTVFQVAP